ncbi:MAG: RagB/SusD family nutrient uptake outer membrane protein [Capnocytophaga sp.]|nr:RagB/SusD family nutrient uptake outer membrane protein [Capnocytophaga sp.]
MKKINLLLVFCIAFFSINCSLDLPPEDEVSDPDAITSVISAERALASAYISYDAFNDAFYWVLRSDDLQPTTYLSRDISLKNSYDWTDRQLILDADNLWKNLYNTIARCNVLLERLQNVNTTSTAEERELQLIRQRTSYLKALCYFDLLRIFCPTFGVSGNEAYGILEKSAFNLTNNQQRLSQNQSVSLINSLLSISAVEDTNTYYITPDVATILQAKLALWTGNTSQTITLAQPIYDKYKAQITSQAVATIWSRNTSPLRLFALDTKNTTTSPFMKLEYSATLDDYLVVNSSITFANKDLRKDVYSIANPNGQATFLLGKYRKQAREREQASYFTIMRVAELPFLLAEAYIKQGDKNTAFSMINEVLTARGATNISSSETDISALLSILFTEKRKEFVGEPLRFFDLKQNQLPIDRTTSINTTITIPAIDYRWTLPIPASEKLYNPTILQNNGWNVGEGRN